MRTLSERGQNDTGYMFGTAAFVGCAQVGSKSKHSRTFTIQAPSSLLEPNGSSVIPQEFATESCSGLKPLVDLLSAATLPDKGAAHKPLQRPWLPGAPDNPKWSYLFTVGPKISSLFIL